eukprot:312683-Chlamydomonas_euryale.AAC.1
MSEEWTVCQEACTRRDLRKLRVVGCSIVGGDLCTTEVLAAVARPGQVKLGQVRLSQARSYQVKPGRQSGKRIRIRSEL